MITDKAAVALALVVRDFTGTPAAHANAQLIDFDPAHLELVADSIPDPAGWVDQTNPKAHRLLFKASGGIWAFDDYPDVIAVLAVEMASILQDIVIDDLYRPWPEVTVAGRYAVLETRVGPDGVAEWAEHGRRFCAVGALRDHL